MDGAQSRVYSFVTQVTPKEITSRQFSATVITERPLDYILKGDQQDSEVERNLLAATIMCRVKQVQQALDALTRSLLLGPVPRHNRQVKHESCCNRILVLGSRGRCSIVFKPWSAASARELKIASYILKVSWPKSATFRRPWPQVSSLMAASAASPWQGHPTERRHWTDATFPAVLGVAPGLANITYKPLTMEQHNQ